MRSTQPVVAPSAHTVRLVRLLLLCNSVAMILGLGFVVVVVIRLAHVHPSLPVEAMWLGFPGLPFAALAQQTARLATQFSYRRDRAKAGIEVTPTERLEGIGWIILLLLLLLGLVAIMVDWSWVAGASFAGAIFVAMPLLGALYLFRWTTRTRSAVP